MDYIERCKLQIKAIKSFRHKMRLENNDVAAQIWVDSGYAIAFAKWADSK